VLLLGLVELVPGLVELDGSDEVLELELGLVELVPLVLPLVLLEEELPWPSGLKSWNGIGCNLSPFEITANSKRPLCGFTIKSSIWPSCCPSWPLTWALITCWLTRKDCWLIEL